MIREPNLMFEISVDGVPVLSVTDRPSSSADHLDKALASARQERPSICPELTPASNITYRHRTLGEPIITQGSVVGIEHKLGRWRNGLPDEKYLRSLSAKWTITTRN